MCLIKELVANDWVIEIFGGIFTSIVFLLMMRCLKPDIKISKNIADYNGKFSVKIYNNSSFFDAIDLKVELCMIEPYGAPGGQNIRITPIILKSDKSMILPHLRSSMGKDNAQYAWQINVKNDLRKIWDEGSEGARLEFSISAKHGLSGFTKVLVEVYNDRESVIEKGKFKFGKSMEIKSLT